MLKTDTGPLPLILPARLFFLYSLYLPLLSLHHFLLILMLISKLNVLYFYLFFIIIVYITLYVREHAVSFLNVYPT